MKRFLACVAFVAVTAVMLFMFWWGGVDIFSRGDDPVWAGVFSLIAGGMAGAWVWTE